MTEGEICGLNYATGQPIRLNWAEGKIISLQPAEGAPADQWLAPGLIDLQVNGYAGVDFQRDGVTAEQLLRATRGLRAAGCTQYLLTLITDDWKTLLARLKHFRQLRAESAELQQAIAGWHIEGPFLSAEPGFRGAHNPEVMCDPNPVHVEELRRAAGSDPVLLTLAPERPGALAVISQAVARGMKVSLGHTNTPADILREAVAAGATGFTHLGNGCTKDLDRHDNIVWRVFDTPGLTVGLICDRIHVSPLLFRLAHRAMPSENIYYTTDAMSAAGAPPGCYTIGRVELEVGADQVVRQPGQTNFAGSALRPIDGVFRAAEMLRRPWQAVWDHFSLRPAQFMGGRSPWRAGAPANFCVLRFRGSETLAEMRVYFDGKAVAHD